MLLTIAAILFGIILTGIFIFILTDLTATYEIVHIVNSQRPVLFLLLLSHVTAPWSL